MDVAATKHFIDTVSAVGAETMIIDAGWYCPFNKGQYEWHSRAGLWYPGKERYPNGIRENAYLRYYKNAIAMFGRLKKKYTDVIFENCTGGGARTDIGFVKNFTHSWVSGWQVPPPPLAITNGMTMVLPPEIVDRHVSGMNCHTKSSLDFQMRNAIFGRPSTNDYNCLGSEMNSDQLGFVKHTFDIYKEHVRPYIDESLMFHHTPELVSGINGAGGITEYP